MVRADRIWPNVYFGRPGALVTMPWPRSGMEKPFNRMVYEFITGSGQAQVSSMAGGSRQYTLTWRALHADTQTNIERYWSGNAGPGPFVLIDPSARNLLLPNQAGATSTFFDARGWATTGGTDFDGNLLSNGAGGITQHNVYNARNLRWRFAVTPVTTPTLQLSAPYRNWYGIPVVVGLPYTVSTWARPDGTVDSSITMRLSLQWLDSAGAVLSTITSGDTVMTTWTRLSAGGVAPANAVYARVQFIATGATISVGGSIYIDEPMLEQDTVVNDWAPGTGVRPVEITSMPDTVPFNTQFRTDVALTLRELAP